MLPNLVVHYLNLFDGFAFNSGSSNLARYPKILGMIQAVHILIAISGTFAEFKYILDMYPLFGIMAVINEFLFFLVAFVTFCLIIFDSSYNHRSQKMFWRIFQQIDDHFLNEFCNQSGLHFRNYSIVFVEFFTIQSLLMLINSIGSIDWGIVFNYYIVFQHIRLFYYIFYLNVMDFQMETIEKELKNIRKFNTAECHRFKWIRKNVSIVHEMACQLNEAFGWSNAACILYSFHELLAVKNWISLSFTWISNKESIGKWIN